MPLEDYRRKRDFAKTPEPGPRPETAAAGQTGRFVVQRHRATRLHYDVRLEIDGVLVSWAVPKGPTLDPAVRRMAVHVEDHPIEYLDFEGVIPAKQYGAGDVIVWDWGTWEPEAPTVEPARAVTDGELKFRLRGQKLNGRFTIVRTSRRPGAAPARAFEADDGEQWLLIKKRDEHAAAGWDAEDHPQSVKTGRTNDEVKAGGDAIWVSEAPAAEAAIDLSAAVEAPMPQRIEPMIATLATTAFDDPDWLFEIKWDGYRIQAVVDDGAVRLWTRNLKDGEAYFPTLLIPPRWIEAQQAIVDGEVVALDDEGRPDFGLLQDRLGERSRRARPDGLVYEAFDLLYLDGRSLLDVPLEDRKRLLRSVLRDHPRVRYSSHVEQAGTAFFEAAKAQGVEGVIAKRRRSRYQPGARSRDWLKLKVRPEQELVVGGWTPGEGNAKDLGALAVGVHERERLRFVGKVGSGFSATVRRDLLARLRPLATDEPPFDPPPPRDYRGRWGGDLAGVTWARPELVIRAEIGGWSRDGNVRQASFKGLDPGHDPRDVVRERAVASPRAARGAARAAGAAAGAAPRAAMGAPTSDARGDRTPPESDRPRSTSEIGTPASAEDQFRGASDIELTALEKLGREGVWPIAGRDLKLTNLDKSLFAARPPDDPHGPITKRELIAYFGRIAPAMLPHLAGRALNLNRFPDGADGKSFWQKDIPKTAPAWLTRWRETGVDAREANEHLVATDVAHLCWLGNQAAFEVHAWTSRLDTPDRPTFALIDIDPGESTTWDETLVIARLYRTALEHLGVRGYPKTTGKRGIQIWIPVEPRYTFRDTSDWVERLSRAVGATVPDLVSWEWAKEARKGRARLDYTQNASIKTLVAPYAVRPAAGAPVSAPITWDELDDPDLRPDRWTIRDIVERVGERGDLFAAAQTDVQDLPPL